jgi:hypothetical protein
VKLSVLSGAFHDPQGHPGEAQDWLCSWSLSPMEFSVERMRSWAPAAFPRMVERRRFVPSS